MDRWSDRRTAWGCTLTLVGVYGGIFALLAGLGAVGVRVEASPLLVPLPIAVGATCMLVTLIYFLLAIRPWRRRPPTAPPADGA